MGLVCCALKTTITQILDDKEPVTGDIGNGGITDDRRPVLQGRIDEALKTGETVAVYRNGEYIGDANVVGLGWEFNDTILDTAPGTYVYTAQVVDRAGNHSTMSDGYTIHTNFYTVATTATITSVFDDFGEVQGTVENNGVTDDMTPTINGTLSRGLLAGEVVVIKRGNHEVGTATVNGTSWSYEDTLLGDGSYTYTAFIRNVAGVEGGVSDGYSIILSTGGPNVDGLTTTFILDVDTASGISGTGLSNTINAINTDLVTRDYTPTMTGKLSRVLATGESLEISVDGGITWKAATLNGTDWSFDPQTSYIADSTLKVELRVKDQNGSTSTLTNQSHDVELLLSTPEGINVAPIVPVNTDTTATYSFDSATYGMLKAGFKVALVNDVNNNGMWQEGLDTVLAQVTVGADGNWSLSTKLPSGLSNLAFMVWDEAGNISVLSPITHTGTNTDPNGGGHEIVQTNWGGTTSGGTSEGESGIYGINAAALSISNDGGWSFFQSTREPTGHVGHTGRVYDVDGEDYTYQFLASPTVANGGYNLNGLNSYGNSVTSAVFLDINRDGNVDVMSQTAEYGYHNKTAYWMQNDDGSYSSQILDRGTLNHIGGVVAYDRTGDGYLDLVFGDSAADSITFIKNTNGVLSMDASGDMIGHRSSMPATGAFSVSNGLGTNSVVGVKAPTKLSILHDLSAVDLDNNGTVDILANVNGGANTALGALYNSGTAAGFTYVEYNNIFKGDGENDYPNLLASMTYADFNGDGWLDLYINKGAANTSRTSVSTGSDESRIYLNDGKGVLKATAGEALWFGDNKAGGASFAVDWNMDGKVDIIEVPAQVRNSSPIKDAFATTLYLNNGTNSWGSNAIELGGIYRDITGSAAVDYNWDGAVDLILYHSGSNNLVATTPDAAPSTLIKNTNIAADGTSMHVRILDGQGINSFYGNTVQLFDSNGNLVSTQVLNPQSSASSNSTGIVSFYGLNANETYSVQLLKISNGVSDNIGGAAQLGGYSNTVNTTWGGLVAGKANESYVLTAENEGAVNDSNSNNSGIVGTGYNDHFFGTLGNDHYNGGGGWETNAVTGEQVWVAKGGEDVLDYSHLSGSINIDVDAGKVTKVINGVTYTDTFENVEQFIGSTGDTVFNASSSSNSTFVGGKGDDTFNLGGTANSSDVILFKLLNASDATGGNGVDEVNGFTLGKVGTTAGADVIDVHELLDGYNGTAGLYTDADGIKLDAASLALEQYLQVSVNGTNTTIAIDRDGGGDNFTTLVTLNDVQTDLVTLLLNNQLVI